MAPALIISHTGTVEPETKSHPPVNTDYQYNNLFTDTTTRRRKRPVASDSVYPYQPQREQANEWSAILFYRL